MRALALLLLLAACDTIGDFADDMGSNLPVLDEEDRCEHWQCFTDEGREQSAANKRMRMMQQRQEQLQQPQTAPQPGYYLGADGKYYYNPPSATQSPAATTR